MSGEPWIEKNLSDAEVYDRRLQLEQHLDEQDRLSSDITEFKRAIKHRTTDIERVTEDVRELRKQIRERRIWVRAPEPQQKLGFEEPANGTTVMTDHAPGAHGVYGDKSRTGYDLFDERYPVARTHDVLWAHLMKVLPVDAHLERAAVEAWHPDTGIFHGVAHWARIELAHQDALRNSGIPAGMVLPEREEMPVPLRELIEGKPGKKKRARKR